MRPGWRGQLLNETSYLLFDAAVASGSWWEPSEFSQRVAASRPLQSLLHDALRIAHTAALLEVVRTSGVSAMAGHISDDATGGEQVERLIREAANAARVNSADAARALWQACDAATFHVSLFESEPGSPWPLPLDATVGPLAAGPVPIGAEIFLPAIVLQVGTGDPLALLAQARPVNEWVLGRGDAVFGGSAAPSAEMLIRLLELRAAFGWYLAFRAVVTIAMVRESMRGLQTRSGSGDTPAWKN